MSNPKTVDAILSGYASYTHVPKGLETSSDLSMQAAKQQLLELVLSVKPERLFTTDLKGSRHAKVYSKATDDYSRAITNLFEGSKG